MDNTAKDNNMDNTSKDNVDGTVNVKKNSFASIYSWKNGDIISRLFYVDETNRKTPRIIAINYVRDMKTGETIYGAAIYRKDQDDSKLKKDKIYKMLRETAHNRLQKRPVTGLKFTNLETLQNDLRKALFKKSVAGKKIKSHLSDTSSTDDTQNQSENLIFSPETFIDSVKNILYQNWLA